MTPTTTSTATSPATEASTSSRSAPQRPVTPATDQPNQPADLEHSLATVARAILRLPVPATALPPGVSINRSGHWVMVRIAEVAPARLSDIAEAVGLDLSTVSRQVRDLVAHGLVARMPDPADGRAALLSLTSEGQQVLDAISLSRRTALAEAIEGWSAEERTALADGLDRLGADLQRHTARHGEGHRLADRPAASNSGSADALSSADNHQGTP